MAQSIQDIGRQLGLAQPKANVSALEVNWTAAVIGKVEWEKAHSRAGG